jgi:hypothetical protein
MPSSAASAAISAVFAGKAEASVGDVEGKVLGHLVLVEHGTDGEADFSGAAQRLALAGHGRGDARQVALGGGEQVLTLAGALGSERVVAADNQALAGEIGRGNGRHVALVEQRHLQRAGLAQRRAPGDRWIAHFWELTSVSRQR